MYFPVVFWAASFPIIKSACFNVLNWVNPVTGTVNRLFEVSMYIPIVETSIGLNSLAVVEASSGITGTPFTVIVAVWDPAGACIFTPPISLAKSWPSAGTTEFSDPLPVIFNVP